MANQNVPTHILSGAVVLKGNSFPSTTAADETFGSFAQQPAGVTVASGGATTISADVDPYLIVATSVLNGAGGTHTITFPAPSAALVGRMYTVLFGSISTNTTTLTLSVANTVFPTSAVIAVLNGVGYVYYVSATEAIIIKTN